MKRPCQMIGILSFLLALSANMLFAQPFSFDENGNGTMTTLLFNPPRISPLSFEVAPDPTGGITTSPVLIYVLPRTVASGDVAFMDPDGITIDDLLRFFTPAGSYHTDVIFYSQVGGGSLADVGIPVPMNPVERSEVTPEMAWLPGQNQPGWGMGTVYARWEYDVTVSDIPEPSSRNLLLVSAGVWFLARVSRRKGIVYLREPTVVYSE